MLSGLYKLTLSKIRKTFIVVTYYRSAACRLFSKYMKFAQIWYVSDMREQLNL